MQLGAISWVTVVWSMIASACLTLAIIHGLIWWWRREALPNALFALMTIALMLFAVDELWMMRAETPDQFGMAARGMHVFILILVISLIGFVRVYLRAGRAWLMRTIIGVRTFSLILNFTTGVSLNYRTITSIRRVPFLGEPVSIAIGVANPWMIVGHFSLLLIIIFVTDAAITVWRRGERRQALVVGASIVFFTIIGSTQGILAVRGIIQMPVTLSLFYIGIIIAMGFELSRDLLRAAELSDELRESEQRMTLAAEAASLGIWNRDLTRDEIWASEKWRFLFGFSRSERVDLDSFLKRIHPDDRESVSQTLNIAIREAGKYEREYRMVLPDGQMRWIGSRGRVEVNSFGKPILVRSVSIDITKRKKAEQEVQERRAELTHLSRVAMLGELSGSLAHELNQPLTAILSNAQAAQRFLARPEIDRTELEEILKDIVNADLRAGEVMASLRLLFKKGEVQRQSLDANEIINEVIKLVRSDLLNHHVEVEARLAADLPKVQGNPVQIQQVLLNLFMNASDAMREVRESERRLQITTERGEKEGVLISVRDHGSGIGSAALASLFEPFFTTKPNGLGLGLPVCRSILFAHGGELSVKNHSERGAIFYFTLPEESILHPSVGDIRSQLARPREELLEPVSVV